MKVKIFYAFAFLAFAIEVTQAQSFDVPDSVLKDLKIKSFIDGNDTIVYKVKYPVNFNPANTYSVFLCLSGGPAQNLHVNYCYYTLFRSKYFKNCITILPVGTYKKALSDFDSTRILKTINAICNNEPVAKKDWIISSTSAGGLAAFTFAYYFPTLFSAIVAAPGAPFMKDKFITKKMAPAYWKKYKLVIAIGDKDEKDWKGLADLTFKEYNGFMLKVKKIVLPNHGHYPMPTVDYDKLVYKSLFN